MSNVNLTIGGRSYTVACGDGEEPHIERLGRMIDDKLARLPNMAGQSEPRMLLFAALLLADELHELRSRAPSSTPDNTGVIGETLERVAEMLESLADRLESRGEAT